MSSRWSPRRIASVFLIGLGLVWLFSSSSAPQHVRKISKSILHDEFPSMSAPAQNTTHNLTYLTQIINLSEKFSYSQRTVRTQYFSGDRPDLTTVNSTLFPAAQILSKNKLQDVEFKLDPPMTLHVPQSPDVDTSILSFGIATTLPRLEMSLDQLNHWLPNTHAPLHVITPPDSSILVHQARGSQRGINMTITASDLPFPTAYFSLIKLLYENRSPKTEWLVLIDDDTFIPSLPILVHHLNTVYDSSKETLISATSDDWNQIGAWGLIPYGGGGIFISIPLAEHLLQPEIWERCETGMGQRQGDGIVAACLYDYTSTRPIFDPLLHQMDVRDAQPHTPSAAAGLFESGRRLLTIHHWRSWFTFDVPLSAKVTRACGWECLYQRWVFPIDSMVLSNGFSIVGYPGGVQEEDLGAVEKTWEGERERYRHKWGPLREGVKVGRKVSWGLVGCEVLDTQEGRAVRQLYLRRGVQGAEGVKGMDGVLELLWIF